MRSILAEKIGDGRFLGLIDGLPGVGYLEDWHYHQTPTGYRSVSPDILRRCGSRRCLDPVGLRIKQAVRTLS